MKNEKEILYRFEPRQYKITDVSVILQHLSYLTKVLIYKKKLSVKETV